MIPMNTIYNEMGIRETVLSFGKNIEKNLKDRFEKIDEIAEYNQNLFKLEDLFDNDKELEDDDEEVKAKEEMLELLYKYMKEKLSPDAYMVFEVLLTPPPYIKERIKDGERITNIMLVEFFDMPRTKKSVKYIGELKQDILYWEEKAKEELHY